MRFVGSQKTRLFRAVRLALLSFLISFLLPAAIRAAELEDCQKLFLNGNYLQCITRAEAAIKNNSWDEDWPLLLARAQLAVGKYPEAEKTLSSAVDRFDSSIPLRLLAYDYYKRDGQAGRAADTLQEIKLLTSRLIQTGRVRDLGAMVAAGKALLLLNQDPKPVLDNFFDQAKKLDPNFRDAYLASGQLALDKEDSKLAATIFNNALQKFPDDPDLEYGLAQAYSASDREQMGKALESLLSQNTNHAGGMLLIVDSLIDGEQYDEAGKMIDRVLKVNPWSPEAWAYRAVIASLKGDTNTETAARLNGLKYLKANPAVDELIGTKLAQKYRFLDASMYQRRALTFDPEDLAAKIQLAQDLLRLGDETEGWQLAEDVHKRDGYDVTAFNLITLRGTLAKYQTLTNGHFILRMNSQEAEIYGDQALALLSEARKRLSAKYGFEPPDPVTVEVFHEQKDFAVRTFGIPHNPGFLGVCFGQVVTANGPNANAASPANWESVLWHEFTHVITLGITKNKMPRWLSEGISVYEELQANPTWGQSMNPHYRDMILGDDLTPVGQLSSAFMAPKSPYHVQFAYYESEMVVEFLVKNYGFDALKKILVDLGNDVEINEAIARHTAPMPKIEKDFRAFAIDRANNLGPGLDWTRPGGPFHSMTGASTNSGPIDLTDIIKRLTQRRGEEGLGTNVASTAVTTSTNSSRPNYWELMIKAHNALEEKNWADAKAPLQKLIELYPTQSGEDSAYALLAAVHRQLKETNEEHSVLMKLASLEDDDVETYGRLMELDDESQDWTGVVTNAERYLAVNPLVPAPYRYLAHVTELQDKPDEAIRSYERLLLLDPQDPANLHYHLSKFLKEKGDATAAKRQALEALEEAPRFRDAQKLLLQMEDSTDGATNLPAPVPK